MKLKSHPEDFVVEEKPDLNVAPAPLCLLPTLEKRLGNPRSVPSNYSQLEPPS